MPVTRDLTAGSVLGNLLRLGIPMIGGMLSIIAFNLADTYFVGRLGTDELAAMQFTFPVVMTLGGIAMGIGIGVSAAVSRAIGERDHGRVARIATDGLLLAFLLVAIFAAAGLATIGPIFRAMGATPRILELIREYMTVWYLGIAFLVVPMVGNNAIRASGDAVVPSLIMMTAAGLNILLDPLLIFGMWGLPALGFRGAAVATVAARATTLIVSLSVLHFGKRMITWKPPALGELLDSWKRVLWVGLPAGGTHVLGPVSLAIVTRFVAGFGKEAVAALGPGMRIEALAAIPVLALMTAMVPFCGQNRGAMRMDRVRKAHALATRFGLWWGLLCAAGAFVEWRPLAEAFSDNPLVIFYLRAFLQIVILSLGFSLIAMVTGAALNGLGRSLDAAGLHVGRMFLLLVPLTWLGGRLGGMLGLLAGAAVANVVAGILSLLWGRKVLAGLHAAERRAVWEAPAIEPPGPAPALVVEVSRAED